MTLVPVKDVAAVVVCSTCRFSPAARSDPEGRRGGALFATSLRAVRDSDPRYGGVAVQEMACLFACANFCTVSIQAAGKINYVLGRFSADEATARALLDYAVLYAASEVGVVDFRDWPEGVKGHFISRSPPVSSVTD